MTKRESGWYRVLLKFNFGERYAVVRTCDGLRFELPSLATGLVDVKEMVMTLEGQIVYNQPAHDPLYNTKQEG
ncbi:MAG: hypothetical protein ACRC8W_02990 [Plesiomonas shigelloides]